MTIIIGKEGDNLSSNPGCGRLHFTLHKCLLERHDSLPSPSFSQIGYPIKAREPNLPYYLTLAMWWKRWIHDFPKDIRVKGNTNRHVHKLNLVCYFLLNIYHYATGSTKYVCMHVYLRVCMALLVIWCQILFIHTCIYYL